MATVAIQRTEDRSVLGISVDFAKCLPSYLHPGQWSEPSLTVAEDLLAQTPCHAGSLSAGVVFPERKAPELLYAKWGAHLTH
jgi:hypothetical protein